LNIVYIHTHDTGRFIQPYGYAVQTPQLMELATEGVLFRHAYCAGPTCSPSRTALLTGMVPHSAGMHGLAHRGAQMQDYSKHMVTYLNGNGYETVLCGIQHEAPQSEMIGYHHIIGNPNYDMKVFDFDSVSWDMHNAAAVSSYIKENKTKPFFLSFGLFNTHLNFPAADPDIHEGYIQPPYMFYDNEENRKQWAAYLTSAKVADDAIGIVLSAITEAGLDDDTLVIYTTDHGLPFPRMKCSLFDLGIGVSLIIRTPQGHRKGEAVDALVSHLDLFPTICDLAGLPAPDWLQGYSLRPILEKQAESIRTEVHAEINYHVEYEPMRCVRTERFKYIRNFGAASYSQANLDKSEYRTFLFDHGFTELTKPEEMLFDLYLDPVEQVNLAHDEQYRAIKQQLAQKLDEWMRETDDPILKGDVPLRV
jgi:N-sulfoglucosamine sulfohydrolase